MDEILDRISKLQLLVLEVPSPLTCEWEVILINKIRHKFNSGEGNGQYMQILNKLYSDYKFRKDLEFTISDSNELILNYRRYDLLFSEDKHDELMYKLRYEYVYKDHPSKANLIATIIKDTKLKIQEIKKNLKDINIEFDNDNDIMRIRLYKKPGDLILVENPFDDKKEFFAVIDEVTIDATNSPQYRIRNEIKWYKQDDPSVTGKSTITEYDINTNGTLFAEDISNLK